jgi:hypothetical protein
VQILYDAKAIQSADVAVVAELTRLFNTKRRFLKDPSGRACGGAAASAQDIPDHGTEAGGGAAGQGRRARPRRVLPRCGTLDEQAMEVRLHSGRTLVSLAGPRLRPQPYPSSPPRGTL